MKDQEERYSKLRRQKINVMLNEEERKIITEKAIKYGFGDCLAEYIRAACIYENIYVEDIEGKNEICQYVSDYIQLLREILYEQKKVLKNVLLSKDDVNRIGKQNEEVSEMINKLSNLIVATLSVNTEKKIQQRMSMIEKYIPDDKFLSKIIKNEKSIHLIRPSNLQVPSNKPNYIVYLNKYIVEFDICNINVNVFIQQVNLFRDVAMKKKGLLSFYREGNKLECSVVLYYEDLTSAKRFATETDSEMYYRKSDSYLWLGDNYSSNG